MTDYTTKEIAQMLDIGTSTLRKWCIALENAGYLFERTDSQRRLYSDENVTALQHLKALLQQNNMSLENASLIVAGKYIRSSRRTPSPNTGEIMRSPTRSDEAIQKLLEHIDRQERFNQQLQQQLQEHEAYIDERINERDKQLMKTLNELQEAKKKKGFFARLFGK